MGRRKLLHVLTWFALSYGGMILVMLSFFGFGCPCFGAALKKDGSDAR